MYDVPNESESESENGRGHGRGHKIRGSDHDLPFLSPTRNEQFNYNMGNTIQQGKMHLVLPTQNNFCFHAHNQLWLSIWKSASSIQYYRNWILNK